MRKLIVVSFTSLDGVIQAPGGPKEDASGGFAYGGWIVSYADDVLGKVMAEQIPGFSDAPEPVAVHDTSQVFQALAEGFRLVLAEASGVIRVQRT